jgi:hypothetical protein
MPTGAARIRSRLASIADALATLRAGPAIQPAIERWRADAAAAIFHLSPPGGRRPIVAVIGGTGTGKSTLINRLLGQSVSATSFRRTFTAGGVAIAESETALPPDWLKLPIILASESPARGTPDELTLVTLDHPLTRAIVLVDTPDLDGDKPQHHAQADRIFRWADAVVFLVTPEKYQMTELLPYYRLAGRYGVRSLFVMNKCEQPEALADYAKLLVDQDWPEARLFAIPRDDAAYQPPPGGDLAALRQTLLEIGHTPDDARAAGGAARAADLVDRLKDQILAPARTVRRDADALIASLRAMEMPAATIDVNPITQQLQRRLQQKSVLYLMGPRRILDRVRQAPALLARLPRTTWDFIAGRSGATEPPPEPPPQEVPDFAAALVDQFRLLQSRIDDLLQTAPSTRAWLNNGAGSGFRIDPTQAGKIADEELAELRTWLQQKWNATPRDTLLMMKLIRRLPGGEKLTQWSEAAPYLLAIVVATHHAFFGHIDLLILGGYSIVTWLTERMSDEVSSQVRRTNRLIHERFAALAHEQIEKACTHLDALAPPTRAIDDLDRSADALAEACG